MEGRVDSRGVKYNCEKDVYSAFIIDLGRKATFWDAHNIPEYILGGGNISRFYTGLVSGFV